MKEAHKVKNLMKLIDSLSQWLEKTFIPSVCGSRLNCFVLCHQAPISWPWQPLTETRAGRPTQHSTMKSNLWPQTCQTPNSPSTSPERSRSKDVWITKQVFTLDFRSVNSSISCSAGSSPVSGAWQGVFMKVFTAFFCFIACLVRQTDVFENQKTIWKEPSEGFEQYQSAKLWITFDQCGRKSNVK